MTKIDIFSGFLGAGKTTLIKKLIKEAYAGEKVVLIENEFGEIGIDGGFLKEAGIEITEMNSGCICCSLVGDFDKALTKVLTELSPDRILIEPSGVGKLSDVIRAMQGATEHGAVLNSFTTVADAGKCKMYMKNFGEFYNDQIENAGCIVLSHTDGISEEKLHTCLHLIKEHNPAAAIVTTPWDKLSGEQLLGAIERTATLSSALEEIKQEGSCPVCGCHHHHDEESHHHQHHHHDEECHHHQHHHHDEECHHHHHHHHADDVFTSWGKETTLKFTADAIKKVLGELENTEKYGMVLRAKGIVEDKTDSWIHFDYVPGEPDVRQGVADVIGRICVIGSKINTKAIAELFGVDE